VSQGVNVHRLILVGAFISLAACKQPQADNRQTTGKDPETAERSIGAETIAKGLDNPWSLAFLPNEEGFLITEKPGNLKLLKDGKLSTIEGVPKAFVEGEAGLLDIALDPDFATTRRIFLSFNEGDNRANRVAIFSAQLQGKSLSGGEIIFRTATEDIGSGHSASKLAFLPDKTLLLTRGDGFERRNDAQNPARGTGKVFRINRDGSVPIDNPRFKSGVPGLFSLGHRNIEGLVVDSNSGAVWATEHGPKGGDELNLIKAGSNYGWPRATYGFHDDGTAVSTIQDAPDIADPVLVWTPSIAPSGLAVISGDKFPEWRGDLLAGALAGRQLRRIRIKNGVVMLQEVLLYREESRLRDVRVATDGNIYILTDGDYGKLIRLVWK
jgi:aldose sugar dehydrogenase